MINEVFKTILEIRNEPVLKVGEPKSSPSPGEAHGTFRCFFFLHSSVLNSSQKVFHRVLLLYISRGSNTNVCTTYDCRERDLVANVWVDQTKGP